MRVVRNLQDLTKSSRDIVQQAKGITLIRSTQISWFSRWSGGAHGGGWSSRAKLRGGQESQTKGQGTVQLPPQWATAEAARRGARRPNKRTTLTTDYQKKTELKAALNWSTRRAKGSQRKRHCWKKEKTLTLGSKLAVVEGGGVDGDEVADE